MCAIALTGSVILLLKPATLEKIKIPLVALAAGSLVGGAMFHMLPAGVDAMGNRRAVYAWLALGFTLFFALEQLLHWHHCNRAETECRKPLTYLILIGDGLHNFLGGLTIAGTFLIDIRLGLEACGFLDFAEPVRLSDPLEVVSEDWFDSASLVLTGHSSHRLHELIHGSQAKDLVKHTPKPVFIGL